MTQRVDDGNDQNPLLRSETSDALVFLGAKQTSSHADQGIDYADEMVGSWLILFRGAFE